MRPYPFPLLSEQHFIVAKLDALSAKTKKLEAIYQQKLADLKELKKIGFEQGLQRRVMKPLIVVILSLN